MYTTILDQFQKNCPRLMTITQQGKQENESQYIIFSSYYLIQKFIQSTRYAPGCSSKHKRKLRKGKKTIIQFQKRHIQGFVIIRSANNYGEKNYLQNQPNQYLVNKDDDKKRQVLCYSFHHQELTTPMTRLAISACFMFFFPQYVP